MSLTLITRMECAVGGPCVRSEILLSAEAGQVLELMARGLAASEVGVRLNLSTDTVRGHLFCVMHQLGASSKLEAIIEAARRGYITLSGL